MGFVNKNIKELVILLLILFLVPFGRITSAQTLTLKQGEVVFYPVSSQANISAYFGGEKMPVFNYGGRSYALVFADVSKNLGNYNLRIKLDTQELYKDVIQVKPGNYPRKVTGVAYKLSTLSKEKQESVAKDKAPLLTLLAKVSTETSPRLWHSLFRNPLENTDITSPFGYKRVYTNYATTHRGVDFKAKVGTPVYAISDGEVLWGEEKNLYLEGPMIAIDHGDGIVSEYLHLSKVLVKSGSKVAAGDLIGYTGAQGADVTGPHLHFAIKIKKANVNPIQFISEFQKLKKN